MNRKLCIALALLALAPAAYAQGAAERAQAQLTAKTGLEPATDMRSGVPVLGKTHRGYEVTYTTGGADEPMSFTLTLAHHKPHAPRLDIVADETKVAPAVMLPKHAKVSATAGSIYSADDAFADRISANATLMKRMGNLTGEYIRVDNRAVTLSWADDMESRA